MLTHVSGIAFRDVNFKDVKGKLYPTVGLKKPGDHVLVNFGQQPFLFDIDGYMKVRCMRGNWSSGHFAVASPARAAGRYVTEEASYPSIGSSPYLLTLLNEPYSSRRGA
jgi:hypothetical protein